MPRLENAAQTGSLASIITDEHAICDDCGAALNDWIESFTGSILCLPCAQTWEEVELEDMVRA